MPEKEGWRENADLENFVWRIQGSPFSLTVCVFWLSSKLVWNPVYWEAHVLEQIFYGMLLYCFILCYLVSMFSKWHIAFLFLFIILFIIFYPHLRTCSLILERGYRRERKRERNIDWLPLTHAPARDQTYNPDMCSGQESNPWPFSL